MDVNPVLQINMGSLWQPGYKWYYTKRKHQPLQFPKDLCEIWRQNYRYFVDQLLDKGTITFADERRDLTCPNQFQLDFPDSVLRDFFGAEKAGTETWAKPPGAAKQRHEFSKDCS